LVTATRADWIAALEPGGIPCGPINTVSEALASEQTAARRMVDSVDHPIVGPVDMVGIPFQMFGTPPAIRRPPPQLGEHSEAVLTELGLSVEAIERLVADGVTTRGPG
jgi:crotonobetainyl-CoA:carnitine CoA-transferase CaiB-like acyl-CoA transferase